MNLFMLVDVSDRLTELVNYVLCLGVRDLILFLLDVLVERCSHEFHGAVDVFIRLEELIYAYDVRMNCLLEYFDLVFEQFEICFAASILQLALVYDFHGALNSCPLVPSDVNTTKVSLTQLFAKLVVVFNVTRLPELHGTLKVHEFLDLRLSFEGVEVII